MKSLIFMTILFGQSLAWSQGFAPCDVQIVGEVKNEIAYDLVGKGLLTSAEEFDSKFSFSLKEAITNPYDTLKIYQVAYTADAGKARPWTYVFQVKDINPGMNEGCEIVGVMLPENQAQAEPVKN